jgi:hypothetical protein
MIGIAIMYDEIRTHPPIWRQALLDTSDNVEYERKSEHEKKPYSKQSDRSGNLSHHKGDSYV